MRLLIVEDAPVQRRFVKLVLAEFRDFVVDEAEDGGVALDRLAANKYNLVLLDLNLPELGGLDVLRRMREHGAQNRQSPVIIVSLSISDEIKNAITPLGGVSFVNKPVTAMGLRDAVREALNLPAKPGPRGSEQRRTPRLFAPVQVVFETEGVSMTLTTSDISPHGAFIVSDQVRPVGTRAKLTVFLPHLSEPIEVGCQVAHVRPIPIGDWPAGFGVRFDTGQKEVLSRLVGAFTTPMTHKGGPEAAAEAPDSQDPDGAESAKPERGS